MLDDDWAGCDADRCLRDHRGQAPLLAGANHYVISATVTGDPGSAWVGWSATCSSSRPARTAGAAGAQHIPFPAKSGRALGGMHHFDLLGHPAVWAAMRGLLGRVPA